MKAPFLIGRLLFADFLSTVESVICKNAKKWRNMRVRRVEPELAVMLSSIPLLLGGTSLLLGVKPKLGAVAVLGFLAGVSPVMHDFWRNEDPEERKANMIDFMKNIALAGGALALIGVDEPWEASVPAGKTSLVEKARKISRRIAA
jgi:uncharacterized membrane protein YphA (DoxX/SURF4 family)